MRVEVIPADQLAGELMATWRRIQQSDIALASPYFCPEFTFAAGQVYPNTLVGVIEESNEVVGFLPFERYSKRAGQGVAESRADYQGLIINPRAEWDAEELLHGCGLSSLEFSHLIASQQPLQRYHRQVVESHVINLRATGKSNRDGHDSQRLRYKARLAAREVGPLRVEIEDHSSAVLSQLVAMKRRQYASTGMGDGLAGPMSRLLALLHTMRSATFAGVLSVLYMGDALVAAHFGLRSGTVWHWWFPVYDPEFAKYSPGLLLLQSAMDAAEGLGLRAIDLGYGDEPFKRCVANDFIPVASAVVGTSLPASLRQCRQAMKQHVSGTRLERPMRMVYRGVTSCLSSFLTMF